MSKDSNLSPNCLYYPRMVLDSTLLIHYLIYVYIIIPTQSFGLRRYFLFYPLYLFACTLIYVWLFYCVKLSCVYIFYICFNCVLPDNLTFRLNHSIYPYFILSILTYRFLGICKVVTIQLYWIHLFVDYCIYWLVHSFRHFIFKFLHTGTGMNGGKLDGLLH